jgi:iron complex transport system substrate-binding protein
MHGYHHSWTGIIIAGCIALLTQTTSARAIELRDAAGRSVSVQDASRIVSIGGAVTEILYALGHANHIVAVDSTSLYPQDALKTKANVGYMRQLSPEGVLGLSPSLVLAAEGSGPKEAVSVLQAASVPFVTVPDHFTGEGVIEKIQLVAAATGSDARGTCLVTKAKADLAALQSLRSRIKTPSRVLFVLSLNNGRAMVAGRDTAADGIIRLAGGTNAASDFDGYKIMNEEGIVAAKPDAVLAMERQGMKLTGDDIFAAPGFGLTPAAARRSFMSMEGLYLLGFGPRTTRAARDLARSLYPDLGDAMLPSDQSSLSDACHE